ncbi:MAG: M1 family metallopeptidase [Cryomorphaceae bacterium]|nr:M1 family metallopeptidase [Cryomorphaceae bacterium]
MSNNKNSTFLIDNKVLERFRIWFLLFSVMGVIPAFGRRGVEITERFVERIVKLKKTTPMHTIHIISCLLVLHFPIFATDYFQQEVNYTIEVELDDVNHMLHGHVTMAYTNNAPHALKEVFILAMPNAYQKGTALYKQMAEGLMADMKLFDNPDNLGFCDSLYFEIDGEFHAYSIIEKNPDVLHIELKNPILPGETRLITTPFRVKIPNARISRLGHLSQDYMITQWYPKAAAYDRDGWHPYPYLAKGEYFSPFGRFNVSITLPANYYVGATGALQNEGEWERLYNRVEATKNDSSIAKFANTPPSDSAAKTLVYTQDNIHDFAFFASKTFLVEIETVDIDGREITAMAMYQPKNRSNWQSKGLEYIIRAMRFYSEEVGPYPYDYVTAVDGTIAAGGGMEYPMITVIGNAKGIMLDRVIAHEVGHNWFYGILATNERLFPYLDEGMNSHIEKKYIEKNYPEEELLGNIKSFGFNNGKQPINITSLTVLWVRGMPTNR